jgi:hypothetical protein
MGASDVSSVMLNPVNSPSKCSRMIPDCAESVPVRRAWTPIGRGLLIEQRERTKPNTTTDVMGKKEGEDSIKCTVTFSAGRTGDWANLLLFHRGGGQKLPDFPYPRTSSVPWLNHEGAATRPQWKGGVYVDQTIRRFQRSH